ncbi:tRNA pseudouridine(55) synthase TruB [Cryobacterium sp. BB736]|uniref:tRNA pseudouridine(55) synthase TruB n=1 Tax=Cryobacterium sp. BB736 TaxID=2746963 RepID=UPI001873E3A0|nr:tRNA pseudouridine(55) synthase TruB [Cryobacterium sp. BB736]
MEPRRSGILLVDKPAGMTSHDVVSRVRRLAATRKVGHAGTLDPMATGLLLLGLNSSTRLLTYLVGLDKEYHATIRLGQTTTTDDAEGEVVATAEAPLVESLTDDQLAREIGRLTGDIQQVPSSVSAIKVDGKRAYDLARKGEEVVLAARAVTVSAFDVLDVRSSTSDLTRHVDVDVRVECSSGTYIRALARDLGAALGVGGHLTALRRTRVGPFPIDAAGSLEQLAVDENLLNPAEVATTLFPSERLDADQARDLANGKRITVAGGDGGPIAALGPDGRLIGLVEVSGGRARALVNFPSDEVAE